MLQEESLGKKEKLAPHFWSPEKGSVQQKSKKFPPKRNPRIQSISTKRRGRCNGNPWEKGEKEAGLEHQKIPSIKRAIKKGIVLAPK